MINRTLTDKIRIMYMSLSHFMKTPADNNTVFFVGGADGPSASSNKTSYCTTYFLDLTTKAWTSGPNMTHCRYYHTCNLVKNPSSGNREIVVVGGLDEQRQDHCRFIQEVEVFDLDTQQWRNGREGSFCFTQPCSHFN